MASLNPHPLIILHSLNEAFCTCASEFVLKEFTEIFMFYVKFHIHGRPYHPTFEHLMQAKRPLLHCANGRGVYQEISLFGRVEIYLRSTNTLFWELIWSLYWMLPILESRSKQGSDVSIVRTVCF